MLCMKYSGLTQVFFYIIEILYLFFKALNTLNVCIYVSRKDVFSDGEAWLQNPATIKISHKGISSLLMRKNGPTEGSSIFF
uniref:Secreted protein n=1 Tax=Heterorhabditis bacteriophora TaxID=37862 RepID=A0A1I7WX29_HETBA